jgi:hypothetical protein
LGFVVINDDLSHVYLGSNIVSISERLTDLNIASPIRENSGESRFIIHYTNYVDKAILCHISAEVVSSLDGQVSTYVSVRTFFRLKD